MPKSAKEFSHSVLHQKFVWIQKQSEFNRHPGTLWGHT